MGAAPSRRRARTAQPRSPLTLPHGWPLAPAGWARKGKAGPLENPGESHGAAGGFDTGTPRGRLHQAYIRATWKAGPIAGKRTGRRPRVKSAAPSLRKLAASSPAWVGRGQPTTLSRIC